MILNYMVLLYFQERTPGMIMGGHSFLFISAISLLHKNSHLLESVVSLPKMRV